MLVTESLCVCMCVCVSVSEMSVRVCACQRGSSGQCVCGRSGPVSSPLAGGPGGSSRPDGATASSTTGVTLPPAPALTSGRFPWLGDGSPGLSSGRPHTHTHTCCHPPPPPPHTYTPPHLASDSRQGGNGVQHSFSSAPTVLPFPYDSSYRVPDSIFGNGIWQS